ncbi:MAG: YdeI/OmpD-associated family protein [Bacteroidetes bacterium]|nr:YdeI/OmpD-associated family protein [Bacteroidota bacterium]
MAVKQYFILKSGGTHQLQLDAATVTKMTRNGNKRVICKINDQVTLHAAIQRTKEGIHYIMVGAKYLKQLKWKTGQPVKALIAVDTSELQFHIPEEFAEVMATDPEAEALFNSLTDGNKRGLIALVNMLKSTDKKIERALLIAQKLKAGIRSPAAMLKKNY